MTRFLLKRLLLAVVTLWMLATIVFLIVNVLPGNVGRQVLGPFASQESVSQYNKKLGTDKPLLSQYGKSIKGLATLDFGNTYQSGGNSPVRSLLSTALFRSAKLALLALVITVPLGILAGIFAARRRDRLGDRFVVMLGLASSSIPEFVTATILLSVFCVTFRLGHVFATPPIGTAVVSQLRYLLFPALAMVIVYFGYIARMTRAGVINALSADYSRTAVMKGLSGSQVMRRHVLRNALGPTISVVGVQIGYLFGGIVGVEKVFNYQGLGLSILTAITKHDLPVLQGAVLSVGIVYMVATLVADLLIAWLNPRVLMEATR